MLAKGDSKRDSSGSGSGSKADRPRSPLATLEAASSGAGAGSGEQSGSAAAASSPVKLRPADIDTEGGKQQAQQSPATSPSAARKKGVLSRLTAAFLTSILTRVCDTASAAGGKSRTRGGNTSESKQARLKPPAVRNLRHASCCIISCVLL